MYSDGALSNVISLYTVYKSDTAQAAIYDSTLKPKYIFLLVFHIFVQFSAQIFPAARFQKFCLNLSFCFYYFQNSHMQ